MRRPPPRAGGADVATELADESDDEREHDRQRGVVSRPVRACAFGRPEDAERRQHHADGELERVLRHARERRAHEHADDHDEHERAAGAERGEVDPALRAAERHDDERDLEPLEQDALEREREAVPVEAGALARLRGARLFELSREDRRLVVQRLVAARTQDRLAQPLEPEREQQRPDDEPQGRDRDEGERRPERRDDHRERDGRRSEPGERGAPAARDPGGEDDRQAPRRTRPRWRGTPTR